MAFRDTQDLPPDEVDIDALFASEGDGAAKAPSDPPLPQLIFTQPADRNVQQFADESVRDIRNVRTSYSGLGGAFPALADEPAYFAEELPAAGLPPDPLDQPYTAGGPGLDAPASPRAPGAKPRVPVFAGAAALLALAAALFVFLVPDGPGEDPHRADATGPVPVAAPAAPAAPAPASSAPVSETPIVSSGMPETPVSERLEEWSASPGTFTPEIASSESSPRDGFTPSTAAGQERSRAAVPDRAVASREARLTPPPSQRASTSAPPPVPLQPIQSAAATELAVRTAPAPAVPRVEAGPAATGTLLGAPEVLPAAPAADRDRPVPARIESPAGRSLPAASGAAPSVDAAAAERERVRALLSRYATAYSELDAAAAANVYPRLDQKALSRAFAALDAQQIRFDDCRIQVANAGARATCDGTATWTPKVGGGSRAQDRQWQFDLQQVSGEWRIGTVRVQ